MASDLKSIIRDPTWIKIIYKWETEELRCVNCGLPYKEIDNIGKWKCKQHVSLWNDRVRGIKYGPDCWDCCGDKVNFAGIKHVPMKPRGCVPADHTTNPTAYTITNDVPIPANIFALIQPIQSSVLDPTNNDYSDVLPSHLLSSHLIIRRFKWY
jgi:hypothetical protein